MTEPLSRLHDRLRCRARERRRSRSSGWLTAFAAAGAALGLGCGSARPEVKLGDAAPTHIVMITVDTLRPDHLGCYGYLKATSPSIDSLARDGTLFERARAPRGQTWPSLTTLLTGLDPRAHGVRKNGLWPNRTLRMFPLSLREAGYRTGAFLSNYADALPKHVERGFDELLRSDTPRHRPQSEWDKGATQSAIAWLGTAPAAKTFTWVHYIDPHRPYEAPAATSQLVTDYSGWLRDGTTLAELRAAIRAGRIDLDDARLEHFLAANCWRPGIATHGALVHSQGGRFRFDQLLDLVTLENIQLAPEDLAYAVSRYDAEVRTVDRQVGELLAAIDELGLRDDTLVLFSADHGDELYDHQQYFFHGSSIYEAVLAVPLILRWPGRIAAGRRLAPLVELEDVMPTLLESVGLAPSNSASKLAGSSLVPLLRGESEQRKDRPFAFAELFQATTPGAKAPRDAIYSVRSERWKLISNSAESELRAAPYSGVPDRRFEIAAIELYDLESDPGEERDLIAERLARDAAAGTPVSPRLALQGLEAATALLELERVLAHELLGDAEASGTPESADDEVAARLEALGYVESSAASAHGEDAARRVERFAEHAITAARRSRKGLAEGDSERETLHGRIDALRRALQLR